MTVPRVLTIGVGGATSSGKTTLAKHLVDLLSPALHLFNERHGEVPSSTSQAAPPSEAASVSDVLIVHQDDFAPREEDLPMHPEMNVRDWDTPQGSIDYERLSAVLHHLREEGKLPASHSSHDHLNNLPEVPLPDEFRTRWRSRFKEALRVSSAPAASPTEASAKSKGRLVVAIVDGFLLYYSQAVRTQLDVKFFLRIQKETLQRRREARQGYATAEGTYWKVRSRHAADSVRADYDLLPL